MKFKLFVVALLLSWNVWAWGPIGHCTVGYIAQANLSPIAKQSVALLLGGKSLADVANWADAIKSGSTYLATHWYHFENIPDRMTYIQNLNMMPPAQKALGGAIQAIIVGRDILRAPNRTLSDKSDALKFLVHFVGDIHQPLHTGRPEDKGGNSIPLVWFGASINLHQLWDGAMIQTGHSDILNPQQSIDQASQIYARYLVNRYALRMRFESSDIETWTNESLALRPGAYDSMYNTDQNRYQALHLPEIDQRVLMAGLRLADTLNHIFAAAPIPPAELTFRQQIERLVGNINQIINLRP